MKLLSSLGVAALSLAVFSPFPLRAGAFGTPPGLAQDPAAEIGDVYAFLNPNDNQQVVLIATFHTFIQPGRALDAVTFDSNVRYRFEIYNDHVNLDSPFQDGGTAAQKAAYLRRVVPNRTIDITFTPRAVGSEAQTNPSNGHPIPTNLRRPKTQTATLTLNGFPGVKKGTAVFTGLSVTPFGVGATATAPQVYQTGDVTSGNPLQFFAGVVDDPFFFDFPAFSAFLDSIRAGTPNTGVFARARDTFAGYNTLAVAVQVPLALLEGGNGPVIGVDFLTQRHATQTLTSSGLKAMGAFKTVDRMGYANVNAFFISYDLRGSYASASVKSDVTLTFQSAIKETLTELGVGETQANTLINQFVGHGDLLLLDTSIANTGTNLTAAFPNGRRVTDDSVDTILTNINNGTTLSDGVNANDSTIPTTFPFLPLPHQPRYDTNVDDGTRN